RTASMTPRLPLLHSIAGMSLGVLLGCALWLHPLPAPSDAKDNGTNSVTLSPPSAHPPGKGGIDSKTPPPLPPPPLPAPPPSHPGPPTPPPGARSRPPGRVPGSIGTGEHPPKVVMPPHPPPDRP